VQYGQNSGTQTIGSSASGANQFGLNFIFGKLLIGRNAHGASQCGANEGTMEIGEDAFGASQKGHVQGSATNNAAGAMQLLALTAGQHALTTSGGAGSILLGAGVASNRYSIVAGDGGESHGDGSITATGGFFGDGSGLTGLSSGISSNDAIAIASNAVDTSSAYNYVLTSAPTVTISVASASYSLIVEHPTCEIAFDMAIFPTNQMHHPALMLWAGTNVVSVNASQVDATSWAAVDVNSTNWTFMIFSKPPYMTNFFVQGELRP
jgi:hypothetical protein